jgi:hypothetical protein
MGHIKKRKDKKSTHISPPPPYHTYFFYKEFAGKPCFCFQYIHSEYNSSVCTDEQKIALVHTLEKLSALTWVDIEGSHRHGLGAEKITKSSIHPTIPNTVPHDAVFLAIRFAGKAPMIGFRERNIFHIVFLDSKFSVYDHS